MWILFYSQRFYPLLFVEICVFRCSSSSPMQELEPAAMPCRGGRWVLLAILTDCQQPKTNKYFNYDHVVPTEAASLHAGLPEWGRG